MAGFSVNVNIGIGPFIYLQVIKLIRKTQIKTIKLKLQTSTRGKFTEMDCFAKSHFRV